MGGRDRLEVAVFQRGNPNDLQAFCQDDWCGVEVAVPADVSGAKGARRARPM
jgi:hypothetical protein